MLSTAGEEALISGYAIFIPGLKDGIIEDAYFT